MAILYSFQDFKRIIEGTKPGTEVERVDGQFMAFGELATLIYEESTGNCMIIHRPSLHQYMSTFTFLEALDAFKEFEFR